MMKPEEIKRRSEKLLGSWGISVNPHLPLLEWLSKLSLQPPEVVAKRAWVINHIIGIGYDCPGAEVRNRIKKDNLEDALSSHERTFIEKNQFTEQEKVEARLGSEYVYTLCWALQFVGIKPKEECPDSLADIFFRGSSCEDMVSSAELLPIEEIYEQADLHYRLHWACRQATIDGKDFPLQETQIRNRRKSLDWIIGTEANWDEISSDT